MLLLIYQSVVPICGCALELFEGCSFNECVGPTLDPLSGPLESGNPVTIRGGNLDEILSVFFSLY